MLLWQVPNRQYLTGAASSSAITMAQELLCAWGQGPLRYKQACSGGFPSALSALCPGCSYTHCAPFMQHMRYFNKL